MRFSLFWRVLLVSFVVFGDVIRGLKFQYSKSNQEDGCWHVGANERKSGDVSTACLCEMGNCPTSIIEIPSFEKNSVHSWLTTSGEDRWKYSGDLRFQELEPRMLDVRIDVRLDKPRKQTILGFGGTLNDATLINVYSLKKEAFKDRILHDLFNETSGLGLRFLRIPIGGTDFSTTGYTLADNTPISNFSLSIEDVDYRIPLLKKILSFQPELQLIASVWSPPAWLKTNSKLRGGGRIRGVPGNSWFFSQYALYIASFVDEYLKNGIEFFGVTFVNVEQSPAKLKYLNSLQMDVDAQRDFATYNLGPALLRKNLRFRDLKLFSTQANSSRQHWGDYLSFYARDYDTTQRFSSSDRVTIGDWSVAESIAGNILEQLNSGANVWIDLSLALNCRGEPNYAGIIGSSALVVNEADESYFRQPYFYVLGHFSKFITPESSVLSVNNVLLSTTTTKSVTVLAFERPDDKVGVVILNTQPHSVHVGIFIPNSGFLNIQMPPRSIRTVMWEQLNNLSTL